LNNLIKNLQNKEWRLNNLYKIKDKSGKITKFEMNNAQKQLHSIAHNRRITLKSRQRGISSYAVIDTLDDCLFTPNIEAGIQSYGLDETRKLYDKLRLSWELFSDTLKVLLNLYLVVDNSKGWQFSNGAKFKIGNFRGDTLQRYHISELAKISKKSPEKANEIKTGAFEAVAINSRIDIESTAEGKSGLFYDIWVRAVHRYGVTDGKLNPLDFYPLFLSWVYDEDCQLVEDYPPNPDTWIYITEIEKELGIKLTPSQINWCASKRDALGGDFDKEYPATPKLAFAQVIKGAYFSSQYQQMLNRRAFVPKSLYNSNYKVHTVWDLGMQDEMVVLFFQVINDKVIIIDEYSNSGEPISYYIDILHTKDYIGNYGLTILPHDSAVRSLETGQTRLDTFRMLGVSNTYVVPKQAFDTGIDKARELLLEVTISEDCVNTISAIQSYRKKWDSKLQVFMPTDVHDKHSNYGACLRYLGSSLAMVKAYSSPAFNIPDSCSGYSI